MTRPSAHEVTASLRALLRARYAPADGWEVFEEARVRDRRPREQGGTVERYLDAVAFRTWASKIERVAFELKATRSDWLRELDTPEKRRPAERYFHRGIFVVAAGVVADLSEVPDGWGLMVASRNLRRLVRKRAARRRECEPLPWADVVTILRHAGERVRGAELPAYLHPSSDALAELRAAVQSGDADALARAAAATLAAAETPDAVAAEVDRQVAEALDAGRRLLERRFAQVRRAQEQAAGATSALWHLARLAGASIFDSGGGWRDAGASALRLEQIPADDRLVDLLVDAAAERRLAAARGHLRQAHDTLGALLATVDGGALGGTPGREVESE